MKREICEYLIDSFVDYAGMKHNFIICAVSTTPEEKWGSILKVGWADKSGYTYESDTVVRMVQIGVSICNPADLFEIDKGQIIAHNKAVNAEPALFSTKPGLINKGLIQGLLMQEAEFIKSNPGKVIAGYHETKAKYDKKQAEEAALKAITDTEGNVIQAIIDGIDLQKCKCLAKVKIEQLNELATTM